MGRGWDIFKRLLKLYGVFAAINVFYKVYCFRRNALRSVKLWKNVPGRNVSVAAPELRERRMEFHDFFADQGIKYPTAPLVKLQTPMPFILCNTAESVQWLLKDEFVNITKNGGDDFLMEMLADFIGGNGIFALRHGDFVGSENDLWKNERKVSSLIFTKKNFQDVFYNKFLRNAEKLIRVLDKKQGTKVDMQELFFSFTMDSIEELFFGREVNTIEGGMSEYARSFDSAHQSMMKTMITSINMQVITRAFLPFPFGTLTLTQPVLSSIGGQLYATLEPTMQEFYKSIAILDKNVISFVKQTRKDPDLEKRKDIIANFLNSSMGPQLTDKILRDIVLNLTIAGRDTTACALSWMFFELSTNKEVQKKLIAEIDEKLQGRIPTLEDLEADRLPYLNGVLYETLRLHPPVPTNKKRAEKDLEFNGLVIPKGTNLLYSPYGMGRNPVNYPNPLEFQPERWIPFKQPSLYEFPVFQAGPRFCLGKDMAQMESKLVAILLLQRFEFDFADKIENIRYSLMLTMSISNSPDLSTYNLWLKPKRREDTKLELPM